MIIVKYSSAFLNELLVESENEYLVSNFESLLVEFEVAGGGDLEHEGSVFDVFRRAVPVHHNRDFVPLSFV